MASRSFMRLTPLLSRKRSFSIVAHLFGTACLNLLDFRHLSLALRLIWKLC